MGASEEVTDCGPANASSNGSGMKTAAAAASEAPTIQQTISFTINLIISKINISTFQIGQYHLSITRVIINKITNIIVKGTDHDPTGCAG